MKETLQQNEKDLSFSKNLQYLRSRHSLSQEALAEQLSVSRQSVSKWESGIAYPEMPTLLNLCSIFHVDLDTLLRGRADTALAQDDAGYDAFMNRFALFISSGVGIILVGVSLLISLSALFEKSALPESLASLCPAVFLLFVLVATVLFIVAGLREDNFRRKNPVIHPFYTQKQLDEFARRFVWLIACPVAVILADVILLVALGDFAEAAGFENFLVAGFLLILAGAVSSLIWAGIQEDKYNIEKYNLENTPQHKKLEEVILSVCGGIMLLATALYLGFSFPRHQWTAYSWFFPVGGVLCAIAAIAINLTLGRRVKAQQNQTEQED